MKDIPLEAPLIGNIARSVSIRSMKDNNNTEIEVGDIVVYNRSGYLAHGTMQEIRPTRGKRSWYSIQFRIRNAQDGLISKVKDHRSIMVIFKPSVTGGRYVALPIRL